MKSTSLRKKVLLATSLLGSAGAVAVPAALMAAFAPTAAVAQDYTAGSLIGHVTDSSGAPVAGASVTIRSAATGVTQTSTTGAQGDFRAPLIPTGVYSVTIKKAGYNDIVQDGLAVRIGGESNYGFTLTTPNDVEAVVVVAKKANSQLDFSQTTTGLAIDVEQLSKQVPLTRSATGLTLLAPGVIAGGAPNYTGANGVVGINGSSVSENAFFINGLNITNFNTYLGGATVPFDFYKTFEVKTGGYPAEFGRATGGIVSATTKSGTNEFYFAVHGNYQPKELRADQRDTYLSAGRRSDAGSKDVTVEAGGPIIRDHLFFYGLTQLRDTFASGATRTTSAQVSRESANGSQNYTEQTNGQPFYGAKLDGYLTSRQHLEATYFRTNDVLKSRTYGYNEFTDTVGKFTSGSNAKTGGENYVFKYTGQFTDWFTLSGAWGRAKENLATDPLNTTDPLVLNSTGGVLSAVQNSSSIQDPYRTVRTFYRVDGDIYFNLLGRHHIRAGYDHEDDVLTHFSEYTGNVSYQYLNATASQAASYGIPVGAQYITARTFLSNGKFDGVNEAWYVQDSWELTRGLTLNVGVRSDSFQQAGAAGQVFLNLPDNIAPRIGLTWDPFKDGQNKFFFNYGKYFLPAASNTAYREAAGTYDYTARYYNAAGYNISSTTGLPTNGLGTLLTGYSGAAPCVQLANSRGVLSPAPAGAVGCTYQNNGTFPTADQATSKELSATEEDEFILGYTHKFNSLWSASATITYRNLLKGSDDVAIDYAVRAYCAKNNLSLAAGGGCNNYNGTLNDYAIINPGSPATVKLQVPLSSTSTALPTLTFSAADLGYPKIKREYTALELDLDRAFDGKWGLHFSYTLSQLKGNYEGSSYSDYASGQTDSGITLQFDTPTLVQGAYGLLPNHHAHVFKGYGSYALTDSLLLGVSGQIISPRHIGCIGYDPYDSVLENNYGPSYAHYCGGQLVPEGSAFETPWTFQMDVALRYTVPKLFAHQGNLVLRADVFNIFNQRSTINAQNVAENGTTLYTAPATDTPFARKPVFGQSITYQTPRSVRFGFDWVF
jgi:hypothetical protein